MGGYKKKGGRHYLRTLLAAEIPPAGRRKPEQKTGSPSSRPSETYGPTMAVIETLSGTALESTGVYNTSQRRYQQLVL